jgi:hypothetical protein
MYMDTKSTNINNDKGMIDLKVIPDYYIHLEYKRI